MISGHGTQSGRHAVTYVLHSVAFFVLRAHESRYLRRLAALHCNVCDLCGTKPTAACDATIAVFRESSIATTANDLAPQRLEDDGHVE